MARRKREEVAELDRNVFGHKSQDKKHMLRNLKDTLLLLLLLLSSLFLDNRQR